MREYACEASRALSDYAHVTNGCTALTSECGPMLEEVTIFFMEAVFC